MKLQLAWPALLAASLAGCTGQGTSRFAGQTEFISAPPNGGNTGGGATNAAAGGAATPTASTTTPTSTRTVQETDLYRLDGNRLYYLNSYRGLMVFDVTNVDAPKLLGRSPIFGTPVDMVVNDGIATVIVGDWYGKLDDGSPFHGSIVRGLDATDPTNIEVLGDVKLGGWVQDSRVVGNVLYAVSQDYGWEYGWDFFNGTSTENVIVSSVSFAGGQVKQVSSKTYTGYSGIFNVTASSILLAHAATDANDESTGQTELRYLDISDPAGAIVERGVLDVPGVVNGWGADNGRWNLDFADGKTAHVVGCNSGGGYGCDGTGYTLSTVDFSKPDQPTLASTMDIQQSGWTPTSRFDTGRLYLSPDSYESEDGTTPLQIYDLTNNAAPYLAGTTSLTGTVWNLLLGPNQHLFALGNTWSNSVQGNSVSLDYIDVSTATAPKVIGTTSFGSGWAWTPAADTFKAFTLDATQGLVVLPFSGWSEDSETYTDGLQLIEFTDSSQRLAGTASTKGWVERGIFVGNRLVSLSDLALSVVDYSNHDAPVTTASLTLARNVVAAQPEGATIAEVSSDWWDNDVTTSQVRVLPTGNADELVDAPNAPSVNVDGVNARVFRNGDLAYIVTDVRVQVDCTTQEPLPSGPKSGCTGAQGQVQVVDLSNGTATLRGKLTFPVIGWDYGWYGWWGFFWYDWWGGQDAVQVGNDALAFRRWQPVYDSSGNYVASNEKLFVVDLTNADQPQLASTTIVDDPHGWWGNMRVVGSTLYTTHYKWIGDWQSNHGQVKYYADRIDLSDRKNPKIESSINVPGLVVGGSSTDPSILYTIDYRWDSDTNVNDFDVVKVDGHHATMKSQTPITGYVGNVILSNGLAYFSSQAYDDNSGSSSSALHVLDLTDPSAPIDHPAPSKKGWGWLLGVEGDRAVMTSGWGWDGIDIYKLDGNQATYDQFVRTLGWWGEGGLARQDDTLFVVTGYWGVQAIPLQ